MDKIDFFFRIWWMIAFILSVLLCSSSVWNTWFEINHWNTCWISLISLIWWLFNFKGWNGKIVQWWWASMTERLQLEWFHFRPLQFVRHINTIKMPWIFHIWSKFICEIPNWKKKIWHIKSKQIYIFNNFLKREKITFEIE